MLPDLRWYNLAKACIIGLTGPTGAGKSTVAKNFLKQNCPVIDCDKVAREVTCQDVSCLKALQLEFGKDIIAENGLLNRSLLAQRAFSSPEKSEKLNHITHPYILSRVDQKIKEYEKAGAKLVVIDAPLLFESGADAICNRIISVIAPLSVRLNRIVQRDGISEELALLRIHAQHGDSFYTDRADYCIDGSQPFSQIALQVKNIINDLM